MNRNDEESTKNINLWELATAMAVTAEIADSSVGKSKHGKPRRRRGHMWVVAVGALLLVVFGASFALPSPDWLFGGVLALRVDLLILGIGLSAAGIVLWLGDPAYHAVGKAMRRITLVLWWVCAILAGIFSGFAALLGIFVVLYPNTGWSAESMSNVLLLSASGFVFAMATSQFDVPLLTTTTQPRLQQLRIAQTLRTCSLLALVTTCTCVAWSVLLAHPGEGRSNYEMIAVLVTISVALLGGVIAWHRRGIEWLEMRRERGLSVLSRVLEEFDLRGSESESLVVAVRELRQFVSLSPFHSRAIVARPYNASYEVIELVKLMEWSVSRSDEAEVPRSITLRAAEGRVKAPLFSQVSEVGKEGVRRSSEDFLARCYYRLLNDSDPDVYTASKSRISR